MNVMVDGRLVNYLRSGKGGAVLLIHGWGDASQGLQSLHQSLAKKFDVLTPDLPGFGNSQTPLEDWNLQDYADFIEKLLAKLDIKELAAVIGHSNGGAIAIKLGLSGKVPIDKLVLIASAGIRPKSPKKRISLIGTKIGKVLTYPLPKETKNKLRQKRYTSLGSDMLVNEKMSGTFKKIVAEDILSEAAGLSIPTLLIYGEEDGKTPPNFGRMFHEKISGSTLEIISGAGHFAHQDQPDKVLKLIEDYIC